MICEECGALLSDDIEARMVHGEWHSLIEARFDQIEDRLDRLSTNL